MTRWLSEQEQTVWRNYLEVIARQMETFDHDLQEQAGLALTDYEILVMLSEAPTHRLRMSELAGKVIVSRSRLTYRVDRLVGRGLIERHEFSDDRRGVLALITDAGLEALAAAAPGHLEVVRAQVFDHLSDHELEVFSTILAKMVSIHRP